MIQQMLAIWSLVPLPFLNPALTSGSSRLTYHWTAHVPLNRSCTIEPFTYHWSKLGLEDFEHHFDSMWDEYNCVVVWVFFGIAFLWGWNENRPFPVLWPLLSFPNLLAYWVQHFDSIIFEDLKQLTGIPSLPLALFVVMLPKAHLTSHSSMSGSRWMITPLCLSESWRCFLYSSSVYFCHLFLISSASVRSIIFLSSIGPIFAWNVPLVSLSFLKKSLVYPILLFSSISVHWSLRMAVLYLLAILWNSAFKWEYLSFSPLPFISLIFSGICKASSGSHFPFCISFSWERSWSLPPVPCHEPLPIVLQALYHI